MKNLSVSREVVGLFIYKKTIGILASLVAKLREPTCVSLVHAASHYSFGIDSTNINNETRTSYIGELSRNAFSYRARCVTFKKWMQTTIEAGETVLIKVKFLYCTFRSRFSFTIKQERGILKAEVSYQNFNIHLSLCYFYAWQLTGGGNAGDFSPLVWKRKNATKL